MLAKANDEFYGDSEASSFFSFFFFLYWLPLLSWATRGERSLHMV